MLSVLDPLRGVGFGPLLMKLLLSVLCGALIGLERSAKNRPAGFRTHILVCLSGTVAAITGHYMYLVLHLPADITRISGQVITGLGFIGAGTIIVTKKMTIKGLTTAAGLWTAGIIGVAVGSGFYEGGLLGTVLVLATETSLAKLGKRIRPDPQFVVEFLYDDKTSLASVLRYCKDHRMSIRNLQIHTDGKASSDYAASITLRANVNRPAFVETLEAMPGIHGVTLL